ncbi:MAG TPA: NADH-quinone oxidoreductase subunit L, partial [Bacillota bacterium]|nr:NADH-quinone oxidoreductase subunit L [Bacillota bacterium]
IIDAGHPIIGAVFIAGAVMTVMYLTRVFALVFLGKESGYHPEAREGSTVMIGSVMALGVIALILGILIFLPGGLVSAVTEVI